MDGEQELLNRIARLEGQLADARQELEDVLYAVSHDIRGPLRSIMSSSMIVLEDHGESIGREGRQEIERGTRAARKIVDIMENLLKLSRLGREPMSPELLDVSAVAQEVGASVAGSRDVPPNIEIQPDMTAIADPRHLRMLLRTLIENGLKFVSAGEVPRIQIGQRDGIFYVRDYGIGLDPEQATRIFRPFERIHGETYEGAGIGLTTARLIVHRHGGKIWAEGELGSGTTIWFTLEADTGV